VEASECSTGPGTDMSATWFVPHENSSIVLLGIEKANEVLMVTLGSGVLSRTASRHIS
jgi:hypothetical protein